ncbi:MAG: L,D-transpeptidase [Actinomycetota bacterium]|nr:L,D-transpeptidase [Actinomycetota bacterium]
MNRRSSRLVLPSIILMIGLLASACGGGKAAKGAAQPVVTSQTTVPAFDPNMSNVATAKVASVKVYPQPSDTATSSQSLANPTPIGGPLVFLIEQAQGDWLNVDLPVRPNGSTGWIKAADVNISHHDWKIIVELNAHRITVLKGANTVLSEPVAVGRSTAPTPGGKFYTKELLQPPNPNTVYGPYAYGLSGFSDAFTTFAGGEAVIGIHGNNDPSSLGKDVSAGCIRMSNTGITTLAKMLPLGVPVEIRK